MLEVKNLTKAFTSSENILQDISLQVNKGEVVAILGSSGAGKSTFLRCLNLLETPNSGQLNFDELAIDFSHVSKQQKIKLRQKMSMVFQQFNLFAHRTALQNVMEGLLVVKKLSPHQAQTIALQNLTKVGLADKAGHYPCHLSGGQQQRVAIARALAMQPQVILFDEPTSALDPTLVGEVLATIRQVVQEGITIILVSHEMNFVRNVASRVVFLSDGHLVEDAPTEKFFTQPVHVKAQDFLYNSFTYNI